MKYLPGSDVLVAHLAGEAVLLDLRDKNYYRLNETAAFVWKAIENGSRRDEILTQIADEFEVAERDACREVDRLLSDFADRGLISVVDEADDPVTGR